MFIRFEDEQESEVNHPARGVDASGRRNGQELLASIPAGEPLGKQDVPGSLRTALLEEFRRYAVREPLGAERGVENLPEREDRLPVARKSLIALVAIGENPVGPHGD
jgi:hypothetical protein